MTDKTDTFFLEYLIITKNLLSLEHDFNKKNLKFTSKEFILSKIITPIVFASLFTLYITKGNINNISDFIMAFIGISFLCIGLNSVHFINLTGNKNILLENYVNEKRKIKRRHEKIVDNFIQHLETLQEDKRREKIKELNQFILEGNLKNIPFQDPTNTAHNKDIINKLSNISY